MCTFCPGSEVPYSEQRHHPCWRRKSEDTRGDFLDKIIKIKCQEISDTVLPVFSRGFGPRGKKMDVIMFFLFLFFFWMPLTRIEPHDPLSLQANDLTLSHAGQGSFCFNSNFY